MCDQGNEVQACLDHVFPRYHESSWKSLPFRSHITEGYQESGRAFRVLLLDCMSGMISAACLQGQMHGPARVLHSAGQIATAA